MILGNACTCKEMGEEKEKGGGRRDKEEEREEGRGNYTYVTGLWLLL